MPDAVFGRFYPAGKRILPEMDETLPYELDFSRRFYSAAFIESYYCLLFKRIKIFLCLLHRYIQLVLKPF